jgi:MoxR-like ATPase
MGVRLGKYHNKAVPMLTFDCTAQTRETTLRGAMVSEGVFTAGVLLNAINLANQAGACTIVLEEINAMPDTAQKQLNPLTDWRRGVYEPKLGQTFTLKEDARIYIIATMNPSSYGGVNDLNEDLESRFAPFRLSFPNEDQEKRILRSVCPFADHVVIDNAVKVALHSRQPKIERKLSTRDLVHFLGDVACLDDVESACVILANQFRGNDMRTMVDRIDATFSLKLEKKLEAQLQASI